MRIGLRCYKKIGVSSANDSRESIRANRFARIALRIARATKIGAETGTQLKNVRPPVRF